MRPIIMLPESKNTAKPPSWRQCLEKYQQNKAKGDTLLDSKPAQKPDRKTTRRSRVQSKRSGGTELASKMTGKPDSQEKALTNSLVTITIKPRWNENGDTGYSCEVASDKVTKLGEAQSAVEVDTAEEQMPVESGSKRLSIDASLEKLRREMNSLRKQDVELLDQLLTLNDSIQDFKFAQAQLSDSLSDLSEITDESDLEDDDQWIFSTDLQPIKVAPLSLKTGLLRKRAGDGDHVTTYPTDSPRNHMLSEACSSSHGCEYLSQAGKARRWHSQVNLRSEGGLTSAREKTEARRASTASYIVQQSDYKAVVRKTGRQNYAFSEMKRSLSQTSLASDCSGYGMGERPEARQNSTTARHRGISKTAGHKSSKQKPRETERSLSQTSLASDCSGYGTGSSERLSSRSDSPSFGSRRNSYTASDSRHKDTVYHFTPVVQKTARSTSLSFFSEHAPTSREVDMVFQFVPPVQKTTHSTSLCCVSEHAPRPHRPDMVYQFVPPVQKSSRSTSLSSVREHAPKMQGPSFIVSAEGGAENRALTVQPSVSLRRCSGVKYAATRPLRSFTKRQSTIW